MKKLITCFVMLSYLGWGLHSTATASARTLERWQLNPPGGEILPDSPTGKLSAGNDASE